MTVAHPHSVETTRTVNGSVVREFAPHDSDHEQPLVALLHGIGSGSNHWGDLPHYLDRPAIAIDPREAFGRRASPNMADYARVVESVITECADGQPVDLVGLSLGGVLAQEIAIRDAKRHPREQLLTKLVLVATIPGYFNQLSTYEAQHVMQRSGGHSHISSHEAAQLFGGDFIDTPELADTLGLTDKIDLTRFNQQRDALMGYIGLRQMLSMLPFAFGRDPISSISAPTLILGGSPDPMTPWRNAVALHRGIKGSELRRFDQGGHLFAVTRPQETAGVITPFLNRGRSSAST